MSPFCYYWGGGGEPLQSQNNPYLEVVFKPQNYANRSILIH